MPKGKPRKKAIIFAETPSNRLYIDPGNPNLPDELSPIADQIRTLGDSYQELLNRNFTNRRRLTNYLKGWYGSGDLNLDNIEADEDLNRDPTYLRYKKAVSDSDVALDETYRSHRTLYDSFLNHPANVGDQNYEDKPFMIEGNKLKSYYDKQGIGSEVIPVYSSDSSLIREKLKSVNPQDDVALFGHAGSRMGGLPLGWWNDLISESDPENCYLGTCSAEAGGLTELMPDVKNLHHTVTQSWRGVNPRADNIVDAMYSVVGQDSISPSPIVDQDYNITNPREFQRGGNIMAKKLKSPKKLKRNISNSSRLPYRYKGVTTEGEPYGEFLFPTGDIFNKDPRVSYMDPEGVEGMIQIKEDIIAGSPKPKRKAQLEGEIEELQNWLSTRPMMDDKYVDVDAISYCKGGRLRKRMARGGGLSRKKDYGSKKKPYPSVKSSDFAGGGRSYPIPTKADAVDALSLAGLHGRSDVRSKVYSRYPSLRKKKQLGGYYDDQDYSAGGILSSTASGALGGAPLGLPGILAGGAVGLFLGIAGHLNEEKMKDAQEEAEDYILPVSLPKQHYQRAARGGKLTKYSGPTHEDGGISLGGLSVEVEGGEARTSDMIHSDRVKVTPSMIKKYPILKKSDKGKTMAEVTKAAHKKFEKRTWDELNDNAAEIAMLPYEQISNDFSDEPDMMLSAMGGDISAAKARKILSHGTIRGKPITDKQRRFFGAKTKAQDGLNLDENQGIYDDMSFMGKYGSYAPLVMSGIDTIGALIEGPEKVDYGQVSYTPTDVNYISTEPGIQRIRRSFGNQEAKLRRYNPSRYLSRMGEFASREADAVTDYAGGVQAENVRSSNRARMLDTQNRTRLGMFNKQVAMSEAEANAANRAALRSRVSGNLANMGTISGQMARDEKLQLSQDYARDRYFDILEEQNRILGGYGDVNPEEEDIFANIAPLSAEPYRYAGGGNLTHRLRLRNYKTA